MQNSAILLISCPDRKGVVASIADFIFKHNGNIYSQMSTATKRPIYFLPESSSIRQILISTWRSLPSVLLRLRVNFRWTGDSPTPPIVPASLSSFQDTIIVFKTFSIDIKAANYAAKFR